MLVERIWTPFRRSLWILPIAVFLMNLSETRAFGIDTHSDDSGKSGSVIRRQDRDVLVKRLTDVVNRSTVRRSSSGSPQVFRLVSPDDPAVKEASAKGIPVTVSLVALKAENGLTPQELFGLVQKLKTEAGADTIAQNAKELVRRLFQPPSKIRELYTRDNRLDFEALARDLTLDEASLSDRKEAFRRALQDDPVGPIGDGPSPSVSPSASPDPFFSPFPDDGSTFDPTKGNLNDLVNQDDLILDDNKNDDNNDNKDNNDKNNANKNIEKNGKDGKAGAPGKSAGTPPTPPQPPQIPPISAQMGGGGKDPQPLPMPSPPEIPPMPPFQMPPPPQESTMDPNLMLALLGRGNKTGEAPPNAGMSDILKAMSDQNQAMLASILQLGSQLLASSAARNQLTASPPPRTANVSGQGSFAARIQSFSGPRVSTAVGGPRTGTGNRNPTGTIAQSMTQQSPRSGTIPGYGAKGRSVVSPGSR